MKEHADKCEVSTPLGDHRLRDHNDTAIGVEATLLAREFNIAARKILEALWISFKNHAIKRKEERVAIISALSIRSVRLPYSPFVHSITCFWSFFNLK